MSMSDDIKNQINSITKRINGIKQSASPKIPSNLVQCAVFYKSSVADNINISLKDKIFSKSLLKKLEKESFVFPYYSSEIFTSDQDAIIFMPHFIKKLIAQEKIPAYVIKDNVIDENFLVTGLANLVITFVEKDEQKADHEMFEHLKENL